MRIRRAIVLAFALVLVGAGASWVSSSVADTPRKLMLPQKATVAVICGIKSADEAHLVQIDGAGTFQETSGEASPIVVKIEQPYKLKTGQKTVPLSAISISGTGYAEGIGGTRYWLDPTRPVASAIWEKTPGTEFPAIQEMRFHFFYTFEAMPGKTFRSINPARMRSNNVRAFPPPSGTTYRLVEPVELEEISAPGVVVGRVLANRVVISNKGA